jgi:hypothetical protein
MWLNNVFPQGFFLQSRNIPLLGWQHFSRREKGSTEAKRSIQIAPVSYSSNQIRQGKLLSLG